VYVVSGGALHQDSGFPGGDVEAYYQKSGAFDHSIDQIIEWRTKVINSPGVGVGVGAIDDGYAFIFALSNDGVKINDAPGVWTPIASLNTTDGYHTYRLVIPATGATYQLFVDGVLAASGNTIYTLTGPSTLSWGDLTPTGGNAKADWDYVRVWK
jgi:hypothetical protein